MFSNSTRILFVILLMVAFYSECPDAETITAQSGQNEICSGLADCIIDCGSDGSVTGYCEDDILRCPPDTYTCTVNCNGTNACIGATIYWGTDGLGTISCTGQDACKHVDFPIPPATIPLTITCDTHSVCENARIICPSNANCDVQCIAEQSCNNAVIIWPTDTSTTNTLTCSGSYSCRNVNFPIPPSTTSLTITCDSEGECSGDNKVIYCPQYAACTVDCSGIDSCTEATIVWSQTGPNILTCGAGSCNAGTTPMPVLQYPSNIQDYILVCNTPTQCENYLVNCPDSAGCFITCDAVAACKNMIINWESSQSYNITCNKYNEACLGVHISNSDQNTPLIVDCGATNMCKRATIDCPSNANCTILCNDINGNSCNSLTVNGPIHNALTITCDYNNACQYATIYAQNTSLFTMYGCNQGDFVCSEMNIYFPPNNEGTPIAIFNGGGDYLSNYLQFYAVNGWEDILFIGYTGRHNFSNTDRMCCGNGYTYCCTKANDSWSCNYPSIHTCDVPTNNPTTRFPTTAIPTTINPTSVTPTTSIPTTKAPTATTPTTNNPTTQAPITFKPTTSNPTTVIPTVSPTADDPTTHIPSTHEPTANPSDMLVVDHPTTFPSTDTTEHNEIVEIEIRIEINNNTVNNTAIIVDILTDFLDDLYVDIDYELDTDIITDGDTIILYVTITYPSDPDGTDIDLNEEELENKLDDEYGDGNVDVNVIQYIATTDTQSIDINKHDQLDNEHEDVIIIIAISVLMSCIIIMFAIYTTKKRFSDKNKQKQQQKTDIQLSRLTSTSAVLSQSTDYHPDNNHQRIVSHLSDYDQDMVPTLGGPENDQLSDYEQDILPTKGNIDTNVNNDEFIVEGDHDVYVYNNNDPDIIQTKGNDLIHTMGFIGNNTVDIQLSKTKGNDINVNNDEFIIGGDDNVAITRNGDQDIIIWNSYINQYKYEPKSASHLQNYVKTTQIQNITFQKATDILKRLKGKGMML